MHINAHAHKRFPDCGYLTGLIIARAMQCSNKASHVIETREKRVVRRGRDPWLKFAFRCRCIDFIAYTHGALFFINFSLSLSLFLFERLRVKRVDGRSKIIGQYFVIISFTMSRDFSFTRRKLLCYTNSKNNSLPYWSLYDATLSSLIIVVNVSRHVLNLFIER